MRLAPSAPPVARLAEARPGLQSGDPGRVVALEVGEAGRGGEAGRVGGEFPGGALGAGFLDGGVGEDGGGDEDGCHGVGGWMGGWMDGWVDGWVDGWMGGALDRWRDGWMDGWMGGALDGWMDGRGLGSLEVAGYPNLGEGVATVRVKVVRLWVARNRFGGGYVQMKSDTGCSYVLFGPAPFPLMSIMTPIEVFGGQVDDGS